MAVVTMMASILVESMEVKNLFEFAMRGEWDKILQAYENNPAIQEAKITKSGDTVLHIASSSGQSHVISKLVEAMGAKAPDILKMKNERGNTALHLAAALGNVEMCDLMASTDPTLVATRNNESETPLFLAALHGKEAAFLCLHFFNQENDSSLCRKSNGNTILHSAISGESFSLAFQIIRCYPDLVNSVNADGLSPLHILASMSNAFKSSSCLGQVDLMIYNCVSVDELSEEIYDYKAYSKKSGADTRPKYPENYRTCMNFFQLARTVIHSILLGVSVKPKGELDEEDPPKRGISPGIKPSKKEEKEDKLLPPNCYTFAGLLKLMMKALLVILGIGIWRISTIKEKKVRHKWANLVMNELVQHASLYKFEDIGQNPHDLPQDKDVETFIVPGIQSFLDCTEKSRFKNRNIDKKSMTATASEDPDDNEMHQSRKEKMKKRALIDVKLQARKKETPLLIAARMGITEMIEKILDVFPVAIQDEDCDKKNIVLLAVEHRQTHIYEFLLRRKTVIENAFLQLDDQGNSALHLAAKFENYRPSSLIPGAALQVQWEIKWYKYVKESMPPSFFVKFNNKGETPKEIFTETHGRLVKEGSKWLTKTSESCSVVAALIATVAFAASATVPGGLNQDTGKPILENEPAFNLFAISSLVALCFSVTALIICLSILTSRYQEKDFAMDLPRKLLIGLTSLFVSVISILISFCSGHYLVVRDRLRSAAYPLYAATCLPMTYFAIAQLPLYLDLLLAIVKKVPQRSYKVFSH